MQSLSHNFHILLLTSASLHNKVKFYTSSFTPSTTSSSDCSLSGNIMFDPAADKNEKFMYDNCLPGMLNEHP